MSVESTSKDSKRPRSSTSRPRSTVIQFGRPTADDVPNANVNPSRLLSTNPFSTRPPPLSSDSIPALSTLAARVFVANFKALSDAGDENVGAENRQMKTRGGARRRSHSWACTARWLLALPDPVASRLFTMLISAVPAELSHAVITTYFLRGPSITLTNYLTEVQRATLLAIPRLTTNSSLRELHLIGLEKYADTIFASVISSVTSLRVLVLRGCTKVSMKTASAAAACTGLQVVNFSYTLVPPAALIDLLSNCKALEVLKVAGMNNWTDATFSKLLAGISGFQSYGSNAKRTFPSLHTLKFRQTFLSDTSIHAFVILCPNLRRLDLSFTMMHNLQSLLKSDPALTASSTVSSSNLQITTPLLEKLSITATPISAASLHSLSTLLPSLSHLQVLALGALGCTPAPGNSRAGVGTGAWMPMTDGILAELTAALAKNNSVCMESINLAGNWKLGFTRAGEGPLQEFVKRVGRGCKTLNLAGIPSLRSADLQGLIFDDPDKEEGVPAVEHLVLTNTGVDDEAAQYIAACSSLKVLEVGGTKFTNAGLFPIIDACPLLEKLDLTSCRGVSIMDRRRFFEVWEQEWKNT